MSDILKRLEEFERRMRSYAEHYYYAESRPAKNYREAAEALRDAAAHIRDLERRCVEWERIAKVSALELTDAILDYESVPLQTVMNIPVCYVDGVALLPGKMEDGT